VGILHGSACILKGDAHSFLRVFSIHEISSARARQVMSGLYTSELYEYCTVIHMSLEREPGLFWCKTSDLIFCLIVASLDKGRQTAALQNCSISNQVESTTQYVDRDRPVDRGDLPVDRGVVW